MKRVIENCQSHYVVGDFVRRKNNSKQIKEHTPVGEVIGVEKGFYLLRHYVDIEGTILQNRLGMLSKEIFQTDVVERILFNKVYRCTVKYIEKCNPNEITTNDCDFYFRFKYNETGYFFQDPFQASRLPKQIPGDEPLRVMELFVGAGGLSLGFSLGAKNVSTVFAIDNNPFAVKTFQQIQENLGRKGKVLLKDVQDFLDELLWMYDIKSSDDVEKELYTAEQLNFDDNRYEVEKMVDIRWNCQKECIQIFIKWLGWDSNTNCWLKEDKFSCQDFNCLIQRFLEGEDCDPNEREKRERKVKKAYEDQHSFYAGRAVKRLRLAIPQLTPKEAVKKEANVDKLRKVKDLSPCFGCNGCDVCLGCCGCGCGLGTSADFVEGCPGCFGCKGCNGCGAEGCHGCKGCHGCLEGYYRRAFLPQSTAKWVRGKFLPKNFHSQEMIDLLLEEESAESLEEWVDAIDFRVCEGSKQVQLVWKDGTKTWRDMDQDLLIPDDVLKRLKEKCKKKYPQPGEIHVINTGPPCQDFSIARTTGKRVDRINPVYYSQTMKAALYLITQFYKPVAFVFENVTGILCNRLSSPISSILRGFTHYGYQTTTQVLNPLSFGIPQDRSRAFILGALKGYQLPSMPQPITKPNQSLSGYVGSNLKSGAKPLQSPLHSALPQTPNLKSLFRDLPRKPSTKYRKGVLPHPYFRSNGINKLTHHDVSSQIYQKAELPKMIDLNGYASTVMTNGVRK
eukprot:TRINITY_DN1409_c0_g2_i6.p1 TRINITY_DN1409_c0_g2~~TRINITY_DN1409_c0_g2_i6.p1  ORF type:complete len:732 (-),score=149.40 TRINITY_DN1409_c0_g2_i6:134-2329(-)